MSCYGPSLDHPGTRKGIREPSMTAMGLAWSARGRVKLSEYRLVTAMALAWAAPGGVKLSVSSFLSDKLERGGVPRWAPRTS